MFIAISAVWALTAHAEDRIPLKSVDVEIPFGELMFEGPGSDLANNNCLACHSARMVLDQPALSQAQWRAEGATTQSCANGDFPVQCESPRIGGDSCTHFCLRDLSIGFPRPFRGIHLFSPLAEFGAYITAETAKSAKVIKLASIKAE
jgi:hypothetical protein